MSGNKERPHREGQCLGCLEGYYVTVQWFYEVRLGQGSYVKLIQECPNCGRKRTVHTDDTPPATMFQDTPILRTLGERGRRG